MKFSKRFVSATRERADVKKNVPAPYMRRDFVLEERPLAAELTVCGLGFYEVYVNGKHITRGLLSPFIVNPDQVLPYDTYDIGSLLVRGENTVAFVLGNGMQNAFGGFVWDFDQAPFISAPKLAFALEIKVDEENTKLMEADEQVLCHPSPIYFDDLRMGEKYDANREMPLWNLPGCDLSDWTPAIPVQADRGEEMLVDAKPITPNREIKPVSVMPTEDGGYLYDFGENNTGATRLQISGHPGQHIRIDHAEWLWEGKFSQENLLFRNYPSIGKPKYTQRSEYICKGFGTESYMPRFTYYGFRYALVYGITAEQATKDLLTFVVFNTELKERASFTSSCQDLNTLYEMTRRSTTSNFLHFPNDCPHREKNGWTADAALSAEHTIMNFDPEDNYLFWERCICRAMNIHGALPGIVPTGGWGFHWGNGPAWDSVLVYLPYFSAYLRDDLRAAKEAAPAMLRYLQYLRTRMPEDNFLLCIGLGDWCPPCATAPLDVTDSIVSYDIAKKAEYLYRRLNMIPEAEYAQRFASDVRLSIREHLLEDKETMRFRGNCQTSQAMAIYYGICDNEDEVEKAYKLLLQYIHEKDDHMGTGVLGGRVIFRVLCDHGDVDLALKMILRRDPPSYGFLLDEGQTTLTENIFPSGASFNHHFWGDIAAVMIEYVAGIRVNPNGEGADTVAIAPTFPEQLSYARAHHDSVKGRVESDWHRNDDGSVELNVTVPEGLKADLVAPAGYRLDGADSAQIKTGTYRFVKA